jgi:hypothetical protein
MHSSQVEPESSTSLVRGPNLFPMDWRLAGPGSLKAIAKENRPSLTPCAGEAWEKAFAWGVPQGSGRWLKMRLAIPD